MEEISLKEILQTVWKGKTLIALITIVCMVVSLAATMYMNSSGGKAGTVIELSFDGINKGQNPDGTKFDINLLKSPDIVQNALTTLGISDKSISAEQVRNSISVDPIVPKDITAQADQALKSGKDFVYYPTQFDVTYGFSTGKLNKTQQTKILEAVVASYQQYLQNKYSDISIIANLVGSMDYNDYDYPEISTVMNNQINLMVDYLNKKATEAGTFRSDKTGMSFTDISSSLGVIQSIDVRKMDSIIGAYNLTKDKDKLIKKYEYSIEMNDLDSAKKQDEAKTSKDMMNSYQQQKNMVLIPGLTSGNTDNGTNPQLEMQQNNSYYDTLAERATDASVESTDKLHDNDYLKSQIDKLQNDKVDQADKEQAITQVTQLADSIKSKLEKWVGIANDTLADYYNYLYNKSFMVLAPAEASSRYSVKMNLAIALVLGIIIGLFAVLFKEYWNRADTVKKIEENTQGETV